MCGPDSSADDQVWWWPAGTDYWPPGVKREETIPAFVKAFATQGYVRCKNGNLEEGFEKIAIFAVRVDGKLVPEHAARQLSDGRWASKMGSDEDIEHISVTDVSGPEYGKPVCFLRRPY